MDVLYQGYAYLVRRCDPYVYDGELINFQVFNPEQGTVESQHQDLPSAIATCNNFDHVMKKVHGDDDDDALLN